jgi:hypothetical protein
MKWQFSSLFLVAALVLGQSTPEPTAKPYDDPVAYEVYAAALRLDHAEGQLVISNTTVAFGHCLESRSDKRVDGAIKDYKSKNKIAWKLQPQLKGDGYKLLSRDEIEHLVQKDPKDNFFWSFPAGTQVIDFSAVGFSAEKTIAFVEMDVRCGGLCGHGSPYILQKKNGNWEEYRVPATRSPDGSYHLMSTCSWAY